MARILLINDEPDLLLLCQMALERAGHEVETLTEGDRSVDVIRSFRPDVIGLDWVIPGTSGEELLLRLKAIPETRSIPILVISALCGLETRAKILGAHGFLGKPFRPDELLDAMNRMLSLDRAAQSWTGSP